jgi:hypothetical protein
MPLANMTQVDAILTLREKFEDERARKVSYFTENVLIGYLII